jgi:hypothetical protein
MSYAGSPLERVVGKTYLANVKGRPRMQPNFQVLSEHFRHHTHFFFDMPVIELPVTESIAAGGKLSSA